MTDRPETRTNPRTSRYIQLSEILIKDIASGRYSVGSRLPTEYELCHKYDVSRHTVREALRRLKELGLVSRRQGSGTTVESQHPASIYVQSVRSLEDIMQHAKQAKLSVLSVKTVSADQWLSQQLNSNWGKRCLRIEGLRLVDDQSDPISWTEIYVNSSYSGIRRNIKKTTQSITALVEQDYDEPIAEIDQRITAVAIPKRIADLLNVKVGSPALSIVRKYYNSIGEIILLAVSIHPGERYAYSMNINKVGTSPK